MATQRTDNYTYEDVGFDNFLTRRSGPRSESVLEDNSSNNIEQLSGNLDGVVKFVRIGLEENRPITGEKEGAIYYAFDTKKLWLWDGIAWYSEVFS